MRRTAPYLQSAVRHPFEISEALDAPTYQSIHTRQ
jgi:hypothetical protein